MDKRLVSELLKTRQAVKRKYESLKSDMVQSQLQFTEQFKPISQPLKELIASIKTDGFKTNDIIKTEISEIKNLPQQQTPSKPREKKGTSQPQFLNAEVIAESAPELDLQDNESLDVDMPDEQSFREATEYVERMMKPEILNSYLEQFQGLARQYIADMIHDTNDKFDLKYGVRFDMESDNFSIGNKKLEFEDQDMYIMDGGNKVVYKGTPGFYELMFKKKPLGYNNKDLENYRDIVQRSAANHKNYDPTSSISGNVGAKYTKVVRPLMAPRAPRRGTGLLYVNNKKVEFVPWKNPNTLVDRLKILIASQAAGHTGHNNEIVNIISALKNAKIIKK